jgi:hypothetical protein
MSFSSCSLIVILVSLVFSLPIKRFPFRMVPNASDMRVFLVKRFTLSQAMPFSLSASQRFTRLTLATPNAVRFLWSHALAS